MASFTSTYPLELLVGESPHTVVGRTPGTVELPDAGLAPWVRPGWKRRPDVERFLDAARALPVTRLALRGLPIDDEILSGVATLFGLRALSLERCVGMSDAGLRALTQLSQLETLELRGVWQRGQYDGGITSAGLESLSALPRLSRIFVSPWEHSKGFRREVWWLGGEGPRRVPEPCDPTEMDDSVARALAGCRGLVSVELGDAGDLTAAGLAQLAELPALEALRIGSNSALGPGDLACLRRATRLRSLGLRNCHGLEDAALADLGALTDLETLSLQFSRLTDAGIRHLEPLQRLHTLDLDFNHGLTEHSLESLVALAGLTSLDLELSIDTLSDAGVTRLACMERLAHLELGYMQRPLTDASLAALGRSARLETLTLGSTALTDTGVSALAGARGLRRLELWNARQLGDPTLVTLGGLQSLTTLWLGDIGPISRRGLGVLATLPGLTRLGLRTPRLDDDGLRALSRAPALCSLFLNDCAHVTDAGVVALAELCGLRSLRLLSLDHHPSSRITDHGIRALAGLPRIAGIDLSGVAGATHEGMQVLLENPSLVRIESPRLAPEHSELFRRALAAHLWGWELRDDETPWPA